LEKIESVQDKTTKVVRGSVVISLYCTAMFNSTLFNRAILGIKKSKLFLDLLKPENIEQHTVLHRKPNLPDV
jgi:hypothetical protein